MFQREVLDVVSSTETARTSPVHDSLHITNVTDEVNI